MRGMRRSLLCSLSLGLLALWAPAAAPAADSPIVRFATTLGNIDVRLLPGDAPQTVANFMGYVNRGDYNGSFFHRSAPGFVIQGGGYTYAGGAEAIPQQAPVQNEFKVSNTRGTLAMAKLGGDPNSATNQWFFNESDSNAANLDNQNGGFTVFGRVIDSGGLSVMDAIASQSTVNAGSSFDQLPVVNYTTGGPITGNNLISVNSITVLGTDTTAPAITITRPAAGQHFTQGQTVASAFACNDGDGVGVATCSAPGVVDTRTVGAA
ncbi:MAG: ppiA 3, partial [Frankiales bacterium]|nr:ppiA 3 [Frankiales bacterium]